MGPIETLNTRLWLPHAKTAMQRLHRGYLRLSTAKSPILQRCISCLRLSFAQHIAVILRLCRCCWKAVPIWLIIVTQVFLVHQAMATAR
mmetsp:Transcript_94579/g.225387  ORF Transcript_94579/g.225387 Transcript_94579/m.225387 type:complete len:89 (+) Transcript_94579:465-731(+)